MWDDHKLLNMIANVLFALAALLAAWGGLKLVVESPLFPLRTIRIEGDLGHVRRADVVAALQGRLAGTFFNMDIASVQGLFEAVPWVRRAEVRRLWPDRHEVRMEEHVPLARWGQPEEGRLVNTFGEVFSVAYREADAGIAALPVFSGPAGTALEVARSYAAFRSILAPIALEPRIVMLSPRFSWQLKLSNGMAVQLGRETEKDRVAERLTRFAAIYPQSLAPLSRRLDYVDLRYPNGLALRVPGMKEAVTASAKPAAAKPAGAEKNSSGRKPDRKAVPKPDPKAGLQTAPQTERKESA